MELAIEIDTTFVQGMAAFIAALIVFVGSVGLLLAVLLGGRLAYLITASTTLGFLVIMSAVWAQPTKGALPLGPVGELPSWSEVASGDDPTRLDFGPASDYPDRGGWRVPDADDPGDNQKRSELESAAEDAFATAIDDGEITSFPSSAAGEIDRDATRLIEVDDKVFGAVLFQPVAGVEGDGEAVVFMEYDAGNPSGPARMILLGTIILFALHLFMLSRAERRSRVVAEPGSTT